jgi:hypothetical protein
MLVKVRSMNKRNHAISHCGASQTNGARATDTPNTAHTLTNSHFRPVQANATCSRAFLIVQSHHDYCDGTVSTGRENFADRILL